MFQIIPYNPFYQKAFFTAYKIVFGSEPYCEIFTDKKVKKVVENIELYLLINASNQLIGFVGGMPLNDFYESYPEEKAKLKTVIGENNTYYLAELGIIPKKQGAGLGKFLLGEFLLILKGRGYKQILLDTADKDNEKAQSLFKKQGFQKLTSPITKTTVIYRNVLQWRTDGRLLSEKRPYYIVHYK